MTDERKAPVFDTSGYVGVDPMYQNYADETHRPFLTDAERRMMKEHGLYTDDELDYQADSAEAVAEDVVVEVDAEGDTEVSTGDETPESPPESKSELKSEPKKTNGKTKPEAGLII